MIEIDGLRIFYVDFHCQWVHQDCPALFLAGLSYCGFDAGVMVVPKTHEVIEQAVAESGSRFVPFRGKEHLFNWGHVVTIGGYGPVPSEPDFRKTLRCMQENSELVIFAHPMHPPTRPVLWDSGETPALLEEGLFDAVELVNSYNLARDPDLVAWYQDQTRQGRRIPITGGCDVHYLHAETRPPAVYTPDFPPHGTVASTDGGDIDALGSLRTLVVAEECTQEAVADAVRNCRTVVETQGQLYGPAALVKKLVDAGYREASQAELQTRRDLALSSAGKLLAGAKNRTVSTGTPLSDGRLTIGGTTHRFSGRTPDFELPTLPGMQEHWVPVTIVDSQGHSLTSALHVFQPVTLDVFGCRKPGDPAAYVQLEVVNQKDAPTSGKITVAGTEAENRAAAPLPTLEPDATHKCLLPFGSVTDYDRRCRTRVTTRLQDGCELALDRDLTFVGCRHTDNAQNLDWSRADTIKMDSTDHVAVGNWDGPDDLSAEVRMLWSDAGLHVRAEVRDDIHVQPFHANGMFGGDCIQIGLDAPLERGNNQASMYELVMGLTDTGPELYCTIVPADDYGPGIQKARALLPDSYIGIQEKAAGLVYELCIPWKWLVPLKPIEGNMFGLFILIFDSDGPEHEVVSGSKSVMTWPDKIYGGWKAGTRRWAAITLLH